MTENRKSETADRPAGYAALVQRFGLDVIPNWRRSFITAIKHPYSPQLLKRAMSYHYIKETKSTFEIERIKPNWTRTERLLARKCASHFEFLTDEEATRLESAIRSAYGNSTV